MNNTIPILLISGPVGVGKSAVGAEVAEVLERQGIPHTFIDFDFIRYTYPRPADDPWGNRLGLKNLAAMWKNSEQVGARNLVISYVVEDASFPEAIREVVPLGEVITVQLSASADNLESRLRGREIGSGLDWHINRAKELRASLAKNPTPADFRIDTDGRTIISVAEQIVAQIDWREDDDP